MSNEPLMQGTSGNDLQGQRQAISGTERPVAVSDNTAQNASRSVGLASGVDMPQNDVCLPPSDAAPCEVEGCTEIGVELWLPDIGDGPAGPYYICYGHMHGQGFCPGCHGFWGGIEAFDFSRTGYCENCASEFEDEEAMDDWDGPPYWEGV